MQIFWYHLENSLVFLNLVDHVETIDVAYYNSSLFETLDFRDDNGPVEYEQRKIQNWKDILEHVEYISTHYRYPSRIVAHLHVKLKRLATFGRLLPFGILSELILNCSSKVASFISSLLLCASTTEDYPQIPSNNETVIENLSVVRWKHLIESCDQKEENKEENSALKMFTIRLSQLAVDNVSDKHWSLQMFLVFVGYVKDMSMEKLRLLSPTDVDKMIENCDGYELTSSFFTLLRQTLYELRWKAIRMRQTNHPMADWSATIPSQYSIPTWSDITSFPPSVIVVRTILSTSADTLGIIFENNPSATDYEGNIFYSHLTRDYVFGGDSLKPKDWVQIHICLGDMLHSTGL